MSNSLHSEIVEAEGHLVDSQLLNAIFDRVIERGGEFEVLEFDIGRDNEAISKLTLKVSAETQHGLTELLEALMPLGCYSQPDRSATLREAEQPGCVPDDFYSTTNHRTEVKLGAEWVAVEEQRMDAVIIVEGTEARCRKLRDVIAGDKIVCGVDGVRVSPEFQERDRLGFAFMMNDVSSERRVEVSVKKIIGTMEEVKANNGRIAFVAGPVVIHSGGGPHFAELIKGGFVDVLLAGNALAVHDVERALYGTSLGIDLDAGSAVEEGHKNHMRAINVINRAGNLRSAVDQKVLKSGVMYEAIRHDVEFVLAGSIRDDGPLPDTVMDLVDAQNQYARALKGVQMVIMLSTMLHSIGVGNMLPSWVKVVCVDINPAVVTKLADRGSSQTAGIVTDVGLFLHQLRTQLAARQGHS
jgi:lysine-ketoglutarate reductase/saccharopine dehydrogenase-like protein (TIGR00300 family)